jgi:hypothetical protein
MAGRGDLTVTALDLLADLRGSPAGVLLFQLNDEVLDLKSQSVGLAVRTSRAIRQPFQSAILVPIEDFMACFAGNIEFPAQHRHFLPFQQPGHESESFVHFGTLLPRHFASPAKAGKCYLCVRNAV